MSKSMKRWQASAFGRQNLQFVETAVPAPGHGEVLVRVEAVALNYRELLVLWDGMGMNPPLPLVPGSDMRGTIAMVGAGVSGFKAGDAVVSTFFSRWQDGVQPADSIPHGAPGPGMLSEYVVLPVDSLVIAPRSLDAVKASTLTCSGLTAWFALNEAGRTRAGDVVVVIGTGGVALFATQIAAAQGARVVVVSGSDEKLERTKALGAAAGINRLRHPQWAGVLRDLTDGRGADHVLELAGGDNFGHSLAALTKGGRVSVIGNLAGDELRSSVYPLLHGAANVQGIGVGHRRALADLVRAVDWLKIEPVVEKVYDFEDLNAALDHLERGAFGKIVVRIP